MNLVTATSAACHPFVGLSFGRFQLFLISRLISLTLYDAIPCETVCVRMQCGGNTETRSKLTPTEWDSLSSMCFRFPRQSISRHQQQINQNVRAENDIMLISQFKQKTLFMLHEKPVYVNSFHHRTVREGFPSFSCKIEREKLR